jgi:peptidoglycan/LPS O-acetylase OafA/YrhL
MSAPVTEPAVGGVAISGRRRKQTDRIAELDGLRAIAAAGVLLFHLPLGFWFGATGVDLFFVLSGYLITGIILRNQGLRGFYRTFYVRRALRIFPIYYLAIALVVGLNVLRSHPEKMDALPYCLFYAQGISYYWGSAPPVMLSSLGHTWTLAIEEQFYLFWPLAVTAIGGKRLWLLSITFVILPLVLRSFGLSSSVLFGHCEGLALGGLLVAFSNWFRNRKAWCLVPILILALPCAFLFRREGLLCQGQHCPMFESVSLFAISISYFAVIGLVVLKTGHWSLSILRLPLLVALGQISYGLYLYHWIIYEGLDTVFKFGMHLGDPWWLDLLKVMTSVAVAIASWRWIEKPILRFKDRFSYA